MNTTYSVKADNCNSPKITYKVNGLSRTSAFLLVDLLVEAFCSVEVICDQTGKVDYQFYYNNELYKPTMSEIECLAVAQNILVD